VPGGSRKRYWKKNVSGYRIFFCEPNTPFPSLRTIFMKEDAVFGRFLSRIGVFFGGFWPFLILRGRGGGVVLPDSGFGRVLG